LENGKRLLLRVRDAGRGFDPGATPRDDRGGFGLRIMRERVTALGGEFRINTEPGSGTEVVVVL
jgi:two-component system NarL family sensor kinase